MRHIAVIVKDRSRFARWAAQNNVKTSQTRFRFGGEPDETYFHCITTPREAEDVQFRLKLNLIIVVDDCPPEVGLDEIKARLQNAMEKA